MRFLRIYLINEEVIYLLNDFLIMSLHCTGTIWVKLQWDILNTFFSPYDSIKSVSRQNIDDHLVMLVILSFTLKRSFVIMTKFLQPITAQCSQWDTIRWINFFTNETI